MKSHVVQELGLSEIDVERAKRLHAEAIVFDASAVVYRKNQRTPIRWDRYTTGGITATNHTVTDPDVGLDAALSQINDCRRWIDENDDRVMLCLTADDIRTAKTSGRGGIVFGPQDTAFLGNDAGRVGTFFDLGVRIMQLTYQTRNTVGDGCGEPNPTGLTPFGRDVVREMDTLGMLVDVSHTSHETSFDAIDVASGPVVLTHAHPQRLTPHIRAKSDDLLRAIAGSGGVVGLTTLSTFVALEGQEGRPGIKDFLTHVEYLLDLVGPDHVGIGSDLDESSSESDIMALPNQDFVQAWIGPYGWEGHLVADLTEAVELPNITAGLVSLGLDDTTIFKILGGNWMRVLERVTQR